MTFPLASSPSAGERRRTPRFLIGMDNARAVRLAFGDEALAALRALVEREIGRAAGIEVAEVEMTGRAARDQWLLTLPGLAPAEAAALLEALFVRLSLTPVRWNGAALHPALNWVAVPDDAGPDAGPPPPAAAPPEPGEAWARRYRADMAIAAQAFAAMAAGELALAWQPVLAADDPGRLLYHEALTRFAPEAAVAPGELFPALERLGMTRLFDHHVMALIGRELERHPDAVIGVNLSGASASCDGWWLPLLDRLESAPALARRLVVEITETARMAEDSVRFVARLRERGCRIALDDFGVGHASIRNAMMIEADIVKIDACFIRNAGASDRNREVLRHLTGIAASIAADVIVEGIETGAESDLARQIQSNLAPRSGACWQQGYWLGRPSTRRPWPAPPIAPRSPG